MIHAFPLFHEQVGLADGKSIIPGRALARAPGTNSTLGVMLYFG
jgi:hypothetical protein